MPFPGKTIMLFAFQNRAIPLVSILNHCGMETNVAFISTKLTFKS